MIAIVLVMILIELVKGQECGLASNLLHEAQNAQALGDVAVPARDSTVWHQRKFLSARLFVTYEPSTCRESIDVASGIVANLQTE